METSRCYLLKRDGADFREGFFLLFPINRFQEGITEGHTVSFVGSTGGEGSKPRLWNLQNLCPVPPYDCEYCLSHVGGLAVFSTLPERQLYPKVYQSRLK